LSFAEPRVQIVNFYSDTHVGDAPCCVSTKRT
jgi:hypothetical protein